MSFVGDDGGSGTFGMIRYDFVQSSRDPVRMSYGPLKRSRNSLLDLFKNIAVRIINTNRFVRSVQGLVSNRKIVDIPDKTMLKSYHFTQV